MNNTAQRHSQVKTDYPLRLPDQNIFAPVEIKPVHAIFSLMTGGLLKIYQLRMSEGRHYLADVGFNHYLYFNKQMTGSGRKYFWRLNMKQPFEKVLCVPSAFRLPVSVEIHNFYRDGLNKFDFKYSIIIVVPDLYVVGRLMSLDDEMPLKSIELVVKEAARTMSADRDYKQLFISAPELTESIKRDVQSNKIVMETGLLIKEISCEFLVGDRDLFNLVKKIYARCEESRSLGQISESEWRRYLESAVPEIALQEETRRGELILNAIIALGLPISESELKSKAYDLSSKIFGPK
ncbi:MAG TPA: hypothetical protein VF553_14500 [Pyrinomonadaceae bacterium]|jgi:hypothetical protein